MEITATKLLLKYVLGKLTIHKGELCEFSKRFFDIHDYPLSKGGDGVSNHFKTYECPYCKKEFTI